MAVAWQCINTERLLAHLRLDGGIRQAYSNARAMNWERGYGDFLSYGFLGRGFLSKFGNEDSTTKVMGIEFPRYDWEADSDPLNMFMSTAQQNGIPAMLLLIGVLITLFRTRSHLADVRSKCILTGFLCTGLVFGTLDGNWLTSFGDPIDRFCLVSFAVLASAASSASRQHSTPIGAAHPVRSATPPRRLRPPAPLNRAATPAPAHRASSFRRQQSKQLVFHS